MLLIYLFIACLGGVSIVVSRVINANLGEKIGILPSTAMNFITGLATSFLLLLASREAIGFTYNTMTTIPLWAYLGGVLGVLVVVVSIYVTPKISAFYLSLLIFISQLFAGIIIDYLISHELSLGKVVGGLCVLIGLIYNLIIDHRDTNVNNLGVTELVE